MVELRGVLDADVDLFFELQRDAEAAAMIPLVPRDRAAHDAHWERIRADDGVVVRTVVLDGAVAGNVMCFGDDGRQQVGYWIAREHWGRGVATAALERFLVLLGARPLYATVAKANGASLRVLRKCGFEVVDERLGAPDAAGEFVAELVLELAR